MDLKHRQRILLELYLNDQILRRFGENPLECGRSLGLGGDDLQWFCALDSVELKEFSTSLKLKRCGTVRQALPRLAKALGSRFQRLFLRFASCPESNAPATILEDAGRFVDWLVRLQHSRGRTGRQSVLAYARFELAQGMAQRRRFTVRFFDCCLELARFERTGIHRCRQGRSIVIWWRTTSRGSLQRRSWSLPW